MHPEQKISQTNQNKILQEQKISQEGLEELSSEELEVLVGGRGISNTLDIEISEVTVTIEDSHTIRLE